MIQKAKKQQTQTSYTQFLY